MRTYACILPSSELLFNSVRENFRILNRIWNLVHSSIIGIKTWLFTQSMEGSNVLKGYINLKTSQQTHCYNINTQIHKYLTSNFGNFLKTKIDFPARNNCWPTKFGERLVKETTNTTTTTTTYYHPICPILEKYKHTRQWIF